MSDPLFFGYGSLVNRQTHGNEPARPAAVRGWRRAWRHTPLRRVSFLTAIPCPDTILDGLVAPVPLGDWRALDQREHAYDRNPSIARLRACGTDVTAAIYAIPTERHAAPTQESPILLSYLDAVLQGYFQEFGAEGVRHFTDTTDGWEAPILDDRNDPIYPRATTLSDGERRLINNVLEDLGKEISGSRSG